MATAVPDTGVGATITYDSGFFANILSMNWSGIAREALPTTTLGTTTAKTYKAADLFDAGELSVELQYAAQTRPPIDDAAATCTITLKGSTTWEATAIFTGYSFQVDESIMTSTGVLKFSGNITITAN